MLEVSESLLVLVLVLCCKLSRSRWGSAVNLTFVVTPAMSLSFSPFVGRSVPR